MILSDLLLATLPSDRMYEYNLNYILKIIRDMEDQYKTRLDELVREYLSQILNDFRLQYSDYNECVYLQEGFSALAGEDVTE